MEAAVAQIPAVALEAEESVLGALMVRPAVDAVVAEHGLAPEHFFRDRHAATFRAILALHERGEAVDAMTVVGELRARGKLDHVGGAGAVSHLASVVPVPGNVLTYAKRVVVEAQWRAKRRAGQLAVAAAEARDEGQLAEAEAMLSQDLVHVDSMYDEDRQRDVLWSLLEGQAAAEFYWPFERLNRAASGGMRRGQVNVVAGITGEGKSLFADQILDTNRKQGRRVCLYDNEMAVEERVARRTTRLVGVSHSKLVNGRLDDSEKARVLEAISTMPNWPIVEIPGWTAEEVAHHIRRNRWDLVVIDILHNFRFADERELSAAVSTFKACAGQANCCIVLVAHINRSVVSERGKARAPNRHDLRWSGDIENLAHTICFVYRNRDMTVDPPAILNEGSIYLDKVRGGSRTSQSVVFNERRLRFDVAGAA